MNRLKTLVVAAAMMAPLPALAYTQEEANACTPDAFRLCQDAIPDAGRVAQCLVQKKRQLSAPCLTVFNNHASRAVAERDRAEPTKY
jgi:hypothetical protein